MLDIVSSARRKRASRVVVVRVDIRSIIAIVIVRRVISHLHIRIFSICTGVLFERSGKVKNVLTL